ncbi:MAG: leucine-rich repeat protein [Eubacteriales bacterium]
MAFIILLESLKAIEGYVFAECWLRRIYLPKSLAQIRRGAFHNCYDLVDVYNGGSREQWEPCPAMISEI